MIVDCWNIALMVSVPWAVLVYLVRATAYRHGIWDGAFNHFLPKVKKEMYLYDAYRADLILSKEFGDGKV